MKTVESATPFVYVSFLAHHTGGMATSSESFYLGSDGELQVCVASSDGHLRSLRRGNLDTGPFFEAMNGVVSSLSERRSSRAREQAEVVEHFGPRVSFGFLDASGSYFSETLPREDLPDLALPLLDRIEELRRHRSLRDAAPGFYARAQRLPGIDTNIQPVQLALEPGAIRTDMPLTSVLQRERSFVPLDGRDRAVLVEGRLTAGRGDMARVQLGATVYRVITYVKAEQE